MRPQTLFLVLLPLLWLSACAAPTPSGGAPVPILIQTENAAPLSPGEPGTMITKLSAGQPPQPTPQTSLPTAGESLSAAEVQAIFARLPNLPNEAAETSAFNPPAEILPPPRPGETLAQVFPPAATESQPIAAPAQALEVLRYSPEGEVSIAPFLSVTFNQPMVALGDLQSLSAQAVPVQIQPPLPGTWRWVGTKTLAFSYDSAQIDRLPQATQYQVSIPAGTTSATGGRLEQTVSWVFSTPPPQVIQSHPYSNDQPLTPLFFLEFNQRINPAQALTTVWVYANNQPIRLRLATESEVEADEAVKRLAQNSLEGRWMAFMVEQPLPRDAHISVTVGPGTPSAEGSLTMSEPYTYQFQTYAPLKMEESRCGWYDENCPPLTPFFIRFNNRLDPDSFQPDLLSVSPAIAGLQANLEGNSITLQGETLGRTVYTVRISGEVKDIFGQSLGKDQNLTFKVGGAKQLLMAAGKDFLTLDPAAPKPVFSVYVINHTKLLVKVYQVQPSDWDAYTQATNEGKPMPGILAYDGDLAINPQPSSLHQADIDLSPYLQNNLGHLVVEVQAQPHLLEPETWFSEPKKITAWVQSTQLGLDVLSDHSQVTAWATDLKTGAPLPGVQILSPQAELAITGEDGTARFAIPSGASYLVARQGADQALLPKTTSYWSGETWQATPLQDELRWHVFDDRAIYRPEEEVHIKGWLRKISAGTNGDVQLPDAKNITYQISDSLGNPVGSGTAPVSALGGFDFSFTLPKNINLGSANLQIQAESTLANGQHNHSIQVQEFRRPEFEVTAKTESAAPYFLNGYALLSVEAKYYAGGGLPQAQTVWNVRSSPGAYAPPGWQQFTFGSWQPWWRAWNSVPEEEETSVTYEGKTDAAGFHYLRLDFTEEGETPLARPQSIHAEANVTDVNRQTWSSATNLLVHPSNLYIGIRTARYFVQKGSPMPVEFIVTDLDGVPVPGKTVQIQATLLQWQYRRGWQEIPQETQTCNTLSAESPLSCPFTANQGGSYQITATVTDDEGRINQSQFTRWVSGGAARPARNVIQEEVTLIPDKETYQPGDTAEILVQSPFAPAEGLLTVTREGILYTERFTVEESGSFTLRVPISEAHLPNLNLQVDLNGYAARSDAEGNPLKDLPARPAHASGSLTLLIPPLTRSLTVRAEPAQSKVEPGGQTSVRVLVTDSAGKPVPGAEVALVVVDEAVLALTGYQVSDPLGTFYPQRDSWLSSAYARSSIVLVDPVQAAREATEEKFRVSRVLDDVFAMPPLEAPVMQAAPMAAALPQTGGGNDSPQIRLRSDFNPLANFSPAVITAADGSAEVLVTVPDNLTRYRVIAVAVEESGKRFGAGESALTARLPLMVRPSAPRFLNFGDWFELPVVLQNQTDQPLSVDVAVRAVNLQLANSGMRVTVPANDRVELRFAAQTALAGKASLQVAAVSGAFTDAASLEIPVYTPSTSEAFATYGVLDAGAIAQPVQSPVGVIPQYGGLEITTSSTALHALSDAVLYLSQYPYECSEQLASRVLAIAALREVLTAFNAEGLPDPATLEDAVQRDLERLAGLQNYDGGFPYWQRGYESSPFNSIHVTHALVRARQKGFEVPEATYQNALAYLANIETHYPDWYSENTARTLSAYALYVRNLSGDKDAAKAEKLLQTGGAQNFSLAALGWLWQVVESEDQKEEIRRLVANQVVETPGAANFITDFDEQSYLLLSSSRRTDAILLEALMQDNPQSDLIPKLVNGLMAQRVNGRWGNTQENVFVLLALDAYFRTYEAQTPNFVAQIWLGETYAAQSTFEGRTTERHETFIPMSYVLQETQAGMQNITINKEGEGRLYYRLGLRYAPAALALPPAEMGFVVRRIYEAVDDPKAVYQDEEGRWHIQAGARVRVKITMVAESRRYHVALSDSLPAGLEIVNPALAVSGSVPQNPAESSSRYGWWWSRTWYEHQNLRDNRAEAFTSLLWDGVYEYTYVTRATTPGIFLAPPAKAEEMYSPEVFGRSGTDWVIVE